MTPPWNTEPVMIRRPQSYGAPPESGWRGNYQSSYNAAEPPSLLGDHPSYYGGDGGRHYHGGGGRRGGGRGRGRGGRGEGGRRGVGRGGMMWESGREPTDYLTEKFNELEVSDYGGGGWRGGRRGGDGGGRWGNSAAGYSNHGGWNSGPGGWNSGPGGWNSSGGGWNAGVDSSGGAGGGGWRPWSTPTNNRGGRGRGGGSSGGRTMEEVESNPFESIENGDNAAGNTNTVINFDVYEDIPVQVSGDDVPPPAMSFSDIVTSDKLKENIRRCKYVNPTPIQRYALPILVAGRDLMACAQTGSGKTAAFCFPIITRILTGENGGGGGDVTGASARRQSRDGTAYPVALILSPTRELSCQIHDESRKFAYQTGVKVVVAYGGAPMAQQLRYLEKGVDILVATPGRLVDMIERGRVSLSMIRYLALDEADRMLDMGFEPQVRKIVQQMDMPPPGTRQTMLFSATFPDEIQRLASEFLSNYVFLTVGKVGSSTDLISQRVDFVEEMDKRQHLMTLLVQNTNGGPQKIPLTLVFVETKKGADSLQQWLNRNGIPATAIHGDKVQMERERALKLFKSGTTPILVATDVAARGLDIPSVAHVINFDLPRDIDDYVHRIGRTGRAGKSGSATAFFSNKNMYIAKSLVDLMKESNQEVPSWLRDCAEQSSYGSGGGRRSQRYYGGNFGGHDFRSSNYNNYDDYNYYPNPYAAAPGSSSGGGMPAGQYAVQPGPGYESISATGWE